MKGKVVVADHRVHRTIRAILGTARTGRINDGKVFVVPIQQAIRIRTGERGESAAEANDVETDGKGFSVLKTKAIGQVVDHP